MVDYDAEKGVYSESKWWHYLLLLISTTNDDTILLSVSLGCAFYCKEANRLCPHLGILPWDTFCALRKCQSIQQNIACPLCSRHYSHLWGHSSERAK